jgi:hypothetical protein
MLAIKTIPGVELGGGYYWTEAIEPDEEVALLTRCAYSTGRFGAAVGYLALTGSRLVFLADRPNRTAAWQKVSLGYEEVARCEVGRQINLAVSIAWRNECLVLQDRRGSRHYIWPDGVSVRSATLRAEIEQLKLAA